MRTKLERLYRKRDRLDARIARLRTERKILDQKVLRAFDYL